MSQRELKSSAPYQENKNIIILFKNLTMIDISSGVPLPKSDPIAPDLT